MSATQIFDDGSTLTTTASGDVFATPMAAWDPSAYSSQFNASAVNPSAGSWADVFKLGISRIADYGIARVQFQNQAPSSLAQPYQTVALRPAPAAAGVSPLVLLILAGAVLYALKD